MFRVVRLINHFDISIKSKQRYRLYSIDTFLSEEGGMKKMITWKMDPWKSEAMNAITADTTP